MLDEKLLVSRQRVPVFRNLGQNDFLCSPEGCFKPFCTFTKLEDIGAETIPSDEDFRQGKDLILPIR